METQIQSFLKHYCKWQTAHLWGQPHRIKPRLIDEIEGDGLQIVYVEPMDTRPDFYVLRIDSAHDIRDDNFNYDEMLLVRIEEQFDNADRYDTVFMRGKWVGKETFKNDDGKPEYVNTDFPMLSWGGGMWGCIVNFKDATIEVFHAKNIKDAKQLAYKAHGNKAHYARPYRYASKGNNFYEFLITK